MSYVDAAFEQNKGIVRVVERTKEGERKTHDHHAILFLCR